MVRLKYCLVRQSETCRDMALRFVVRSVTEKEKFNTLSAELLSTFPNLKVVTLNIQPEHKAVLEGPEEVFLSEQQRIEDALGPFKFLLSPQSFSQVTTNVAIKLYATVQNIAAQSKPSAALDLYCGAGIFSSFIGLNSGKVTGVEMSEPAILDAKLSASHNGLKNLEFCVSDVDAWVEKEASGTYEMILVNPPRRGNIKSRD